jgi:hypothetical protein
MQNQQARAIVRDIKFYNHLRTRFGSRAAWQQWLNTSEGLVEALRDTRYLTWPEVD